MPSRYSSQKFSFFLTTDNRLGKGLSVYKKKCKNSQNLKFLSIADTLSPGWLVMPFTNCTELYKHLKKGLLSTFTCVTPQSSRTLLIATPASKAISLPLLVKGGSLRFSMKVLSPPPITWSALSLCLTIQITPFFT